jgi:hypothetical protein
MSDEKELIECTHIEAIRLMSGMYKEDYQYMGAMFAMINICARNYLGDAEDDFTNEQMEKLGIRLVRHG